MAGTAMRVALRTRRFRLTIGVMPARRVVVIAQPGVELLDVAGPVEVFSIASRLLGVGNGYDTVLASSHAGPIATGGGTRLVADVALGDVDGRIDTLLIGGALLVDGDQLAAVIDPDLVAHVRALADRSRRVVSVCVGAHVLAEAGLLNGKRATTHWATADSLRASHPEVDVDADAIFVRDGNVWTSAGVSAGMDLALALVADDHGEQLARFVARWLVMYLKRPGGQSQFSAHLNFDPSRQPSIRQVQEWIPDHLTEDLSVPALARRAHMSVRHFARVFRAETGVTPADHVELLRVEAARRLLEESDASLAVVAAESGFGSLASLHRAFQARLRVTPGQYRQHFRPAPTAV